MKKRVREARKMDVEKVLKRISILMDDIEDMIHSAAPEAKNDLLYIYSEIEDIYNMLRMSKRMSRM
jgi:ElaB/YqjD/DUF883 family membrane-anchored ribosome-binding protein